MSNTGHFTLGRTGSMKTFKSSFVFVLDRNSPRPCRERWDEGSSSFFDGPRRSTITQDHSPAKSLRLNTGEHPPTWTIHSPWLLSSILFDYTLFSLIFEFGWTIPCIVTALSGDFMTPLFGAAPRSHRWKTTFHRISYAPMFGLYVGLSKDLLINLCTPHTVPKRRVDN